MTDTAFFNTVRSSLFAGNLTQPQVDGLNTLMAAWAAGGDGDERKLAYLLATAFHETAQTMQPIKEYGDDAYLKAKPYYPYFGRGYVQLTWKENYAKASAALGLPMLTTVPPLPYLVGRPDSALDPDTAGKIIVRGMMEGWFTGRKLADYIGPNKEDYIGARSIVNGSDRAALIAGYAAQFVRALAAQATVSPAIPAQAPAPASPAQPYPPLPAPTPLSKPSPAPTGIWQAVLTIFNAILALLKRKV